MRLKLLIQEKRSGSNLVIINLKMVAIIDK